jgi:hypothetical protein
MEITQDMERFACAYCGKQQIVQREERTVSLRPMTSKERAQWRYELDEQIYLLRKDLTQNTPEILARIHELEAERDSEKIAAVDALEEEKQRKRDEWEEEMCRRKIRIVGGFR